MSSGLLRREAEENISANPFTKMKQFFCNHRERVTVIRLLLYTGLKPKSRSISECCTLRKSWSSVKDEYSTRINSTRPPRFHREKQPLPTLHRIQEGRVEDRRYPGRFDSQETKWKVSVWQQIEKYLPQWRPDTLRKEEKESLKRIGGQRNGGVLTGYALHHERKNHKTEANEESDRSGMQWNWYTDLTQTVKVSNVMSFGE